MTAELERRIQAIEMGCYRRLLNISYSPFDERGGSQQNATGVYDDLLIMKKRKCPHLEILWHGEDNSAGHSERSKKERKTEEEMRR